MKFVHAADLHVDSQLHGLAQYPGAPIERLRLATRQALTSLVNVCLEEQAAFLVIAGDLYDYDWKDFHTAIFVANELRRAAIPVLLILGNHDAREEMTRRTPWPDNVQLFDERQPETKRLSIEGRSVAVHGMSFARRAEPRNLVPQYPPPVDAAFNIGLLHTSADCTSSHNPYAPCSVDDLVRKDYQYWALGHVHSHVVLHRHPHVVYSGNTQGRHAREAGVKGCLVVTVEEDEVVDLEHRATDVVRWFDETVELNPEHGLDDLYEQADILLAAVRERADDRLSAVRLTFAGPCNAHAELLDAVKQAEAIAELQHRASDRGDVWLEKIRFETRPACNLHELRQEPGLLGELLREIDECAADPLRLAELAQQAESLNPLLLKVGAHIKSQGLDLHSSHDLGRWLKEAERILVHHLTDEGT